MPLEHEQGHRALGQALPVPAKAACLLGGDGAGRAPQPESVSAPTTGATGAPACLVALLTPAPHRLAGVQHLLVRPPSSPLLRPPPLGHCFSPAHGQLGRGGQTGVLTCALRWGGWRGEETVGHRYAPKERTVLSKREPRNYSSRGQLKPQTFLKPLLMPHAYMWSLTDSPFLLFFIIVIKITAVGFKHPLLVRVLLGQEPVSSGLWGFV